MLVGRAPHSHVSCRWRHQGGHLRQEKSRKVEHSTQSQKEVVFPLGVNLGPSGRADLEDVAPAVIGAVLVSDTKSTVGR